MIGDQSLFTRSDGIERLWEISTTLLDDPPPAEPYEPGSWGPASVGSSASSTIGSLTRGFPDPGAPLR